MYFRFADVKQYVCGNERSQTTELRQLVAGIKDGYVATSVGIHRSSRLQLQESGRASAEALRAAAKKRIGG